MTVHGTKYSADLLIIKKGDYMTKVQTLKDLMAIRGEVNPDWKGRTTTDDHVLAINTTGEDDTPVDDYAVVEGATIGVDSGLNAQSDTKEYIREGSSTIKTGTQRTFAVTADREVGNTYQDFVCSHAIMYGTGQDVIVDYVWFCLYNGKGEKGKVSVLTQSDGSGDAGESASVEVEFHKVGSNPDEYAYKAAEAAQASAPKTTGK